MLVVLVVVKVAAVLLDIIDAERLGVDLLGAQAELLELALDVPLLLALGVLDPDRLHVGTLQNVVPLAVVLAVVRLRGGEEVGAVDGLGEHHRHLVPELLRLARKRLESILKVVQRLGPGIGSFGKGPGHLEDLLLLSQGR